MRHEVGESRVATGSRGWLVVGQREAADLHDWVIVRNGRQFLCRATLGEENSRMEQRPLGLRVEIGSMTWIWQGIEPVRTGGQVTVALSAGPDRVLGGE